MTQMNSIFSLAAMFATAAVVSIPLGATSAEAAAVRSLYDCKFNSRAKTIGCCNSYVAKRGQPFWMRETNSSCLEVVVCTKGTYSTPNAKACYIKVIFGEGGGGGDDDDTPNDRTRTPNDSNLR
jgi:hypothetical protein